jgi:hypothetical protein
MSNLARTQIAQVLGPIADGERVLRPARRAADSPNLQTRKINIGVRSQTNQPGGRPLVAGSAAPAAHARIYLGHQRVVPPHEVDDHVQLTLGKG